jgi:hypothetical protein
MRLVSKFVALALILIFCTPLNFASATNSVLDRPPANYDSFKSKINDSLVGFNCSGNNSIGFSANWTITTEEKNQGRNSNIFTSGNSLESCGGYNATFNFDYKGSTYEGKSWNTTSNLPDFGGFSTSAVIPNLPLYGSDAPSVGSWVGVVRYAPGFGFIWTESRVRAYNPETLIFAIDPFVPLTEKNALVFNSNSDFMGIVSTMAIKKVDGLVTVHGAPLQCPLNKLNPTKVITNCRSFAQDIWTDSSSNSTTGTKGKNEVCVLATPGSGYSDKSNLEEQCTSSDNTSWEFVFCSTHPKHELQIYSNKKWIKVKTVTAVKSKETCQDSANNYDLRLKESKITKYRIKSSGNSKFQIAYMNLTLTQSINS